MDDQLLNAQMDVLQSADVLVLNEVDWGMKRSDYRAVVKDLADALKMNWAYGVEFVEVDPKVLGTQSFADVENETERKELDELFSADKSRLLALHGNAILSRYPLRDVKLVPFQYQAYDWYNGEKKYGPLEAGKRKGASLVFAEQSCAKCAAVAAPTLLRRSMCPISPNGRSPLWRLTLRTAPRQRAASRRRMSFLT